MKLVYRTLGLLLLMAWFGHGRSQSLVSGWQTQSIHGPSQFGIADSLAIDFNDDGLTDVVAVSLDDGHLRAYINQGDLRFTQQLLSTEVYGGFRMVATDLNEDGEIDFVITSIYTQEVMALLHQPSGYQKQIIAAGVLLPTDARVGDFDNDGLLDVVSLSFEENIVLLHRQLPSGLFETHEVAEQINRPRKMVVADFNLDGLTDVAVISSGDNKLHMLKNIGNNEFKKGLVSDRMEGGRFVALCDLNGDALVDLVASASTADKVALITNQGNMQFTEQFLLSTVIGPNDLLCHDLDDDGEQELISLAGPVSLIETHELTGPTNSRIVASVRDGYASLEVARFDGINPFILTASFFENRNVLYVPESTNKETVVWEDFPDGANEVKEGDINGDGVIDWVVPSFRDDRVQWYDGSNFAHHIIAENIDGAARVVVVDLDNDGRMDVLSAASFANQFYWHRNIGNGQFETVSVYDDARFANGLAVGDLDQDGQLDVVGTSGSDDSVRWFKRQGLDFTVHLIDDSGDAPNEVTVADLNQDGLLDLVVPNAFSDDVVLYENLGAGQFMARQIATDLDRVDSVTLKHLNEDDLLDLVVSVTAENRVVALINQLSGPFQLQPLIESISTPKKSKLNRFNPNDFLLINHFINGLETAAIYLLAAEAQNGDQLFVFSNSTLNTSHVYLGTLYDAIFKDGFAGQ